MKEYKLYRTPNLEKMGDDCTYCNECTNDLPCWDCSDERQYKIKTDLEEWEVYKTLESNDDYSHVKIGSIKTKAVNIDEVLREFMKTHNIDISDTFMWLYLDFNEDYHCDIYKNSNNEYDDNYPLYMCVRKTYLYDRKEYFDDYACDDESKMYNDSDYDDERYFDPYDYSLTKDECNNNL